MSTKISISCDNDYHLYKECFDEELVFLLLENPVSYEVKHWGCSVDSVTVAFPVPLMRKMAKEFLENVEHTYLNESSDD